jgi:drug/metabolite transporter (DMT)-like permease
LSEEKKGEFFYEFAKDSYDGVKETLSSIDDKTNNLFTLDVALVTVVTGLTYFVIEKLILAGKYQPVLLTPVAMSLAMFVISVIMGIIAYAPTERNIVDPQVLIQELKEDQYGTVLTRTAATIAYSASRNSDLAVKKANKVRWMSWFLLLGVFFASIGFLLFFYAIK